MGREVSVGKVKQALSATAPEEFAGQFGAPTEAVSGRGAFFLRRAAVLVVAMLCLQGCFDSVESGLSIEEQRRTEFNVAVAGFGGGCFPEGVLSNFTKEEISSHHLDQCSADAQLAKLLAGYSHQTSILNFLQDDNFNCVVTRQFAHCHGEKSHDETPSALNQPPYPTTRLTYFVDVHFQVRNGAYDENEVQVIIRRVDRTL